MQIDVGSRTDVGLVRTNNEDHYGVDFPLNLFVLCDGMGGQAGGEIASRMAVETVLAHCIDLAGSSGQTFVGNRIEEFTAPTNRLASGIRLSSRIIYQEAITRPELNGMGSTVVAVRIIDNIMSLAHVGDSRIYLFRERQPQQLTQDHSLVMEQVRQGVMTQEEAERSELSNVILRALGVESHVEVDMDELWVGAGDQILLCSDGLTHMVTDKEIAEVLTQPGTPQQVADWLVELANERGGEDNTTVIVLRLIPAPVSGWRRWIGMFREVIGNGKSSSAI